MDMDDVYEWTMRVLLAVIVAMAAVALIMLLLGAINEVTYQMRRRRLIRRATSRSSSSSSSVIEKLLGSIPDVAYKDSSADGGAGGGDSDRESCVICVTPYEAGETCSVLPACKHLFHKACVAKWLRVRCTCPLCRAAVVVASPLPPPPHPSSTSPQGDLNAAENMV